MPQCFKFERFTVYFWSNENEEPIHVHVAEGKPSAHGTKFWLTSTGGVILASNGGNLAPKDILRVEKAILLNCDLIIDMWNERFGYVSYYA